jgi:replication factor A1
VSFNRKVRLTKNMSDQPGDVSTESQPGITVAQPANTAPIEVQPEPTEPMMQQQLAAPSAASSSGGSSSISSGSSDGVVVELTGGSVKELFVNDKTQTPPILQIVDIQPLNNNNKGGGGSGGDSKSVKNRVLFSDGTNFMQAMVATSLNEKIQAGEIKTNCIVRLKDFRTNKVPDGRKILIALKMDVISPVSGRIGKPTDIEAPATPSTPLSGQKRKAPDQKQPPSQAQPQQQPQPHRVVAISELNVHVGRWAIKARVSKKSEMKLYSNNKGDGKLFSVDFLDSEGGQIRATAFNAQADKFYDILHGGQVYLVQNGQIKNIDRSKRWNQNATHNCEIFFSGETEIMQVPDDPTIEGTRYDFVKLRDIPNLASNETIDALAIVVHISPLSDITSKKSGKSIPKRIITIRDDTDKSIEVTLWGATATLNTEERLGGFPVVALKGLQVTDYGGKSLSMGFDGSLVIAPDRKEAEALKHWWAALADKAAPPEALTNKLTPDNQRMTTIEEIEKLKLGYGEKPDYAVLRINITQFNYSRERPPWYKACNSTVKAGRGGDGKSERVCNKKVVETDGRYTCLDCGPSDYKNRYMLNCQASDGSGSVWISAFDDIATVILGGKTADELASMLEEGPPQSDLVPVIFKQDALFAYWLVKCRIKAEQLKEGDAPKQRIQIMTAKPANFREEISHLKSVLQPTD